MAKIKEIKAIEGETYGVGSVLGIVEATQEEIDRTGVSTVEESQSARQEETQDADQDEANLHFKVGGDDYFEPRTVEPNVKGLPVPTGKKGASYISPRMRARMNELGIHASDISAIAGSGAGGRVTIDDP